MKPSTLAKYNKIVIAAEMLSEAQKRYFQAMRDVDYVTSILLSGAVIGVVSPLLKEQKRGRTSHQLLARVSKLVAQPDTTSLNEWMFRDVYNGLKHAGKDKRKDQPE